MKNISRLIVAIIGFCLLSSAQSLAQSIPISTCPFSITTPGNYAVSRNLTSVGTCITILVDGVAIDLQGHSITGNAVGVGISSGGPHVIIANGTVGRFGGRGIDAPEAVIANMILQGNGEGVGASIVVDSVISDNKGDGISSGREISNVKVTNNGHDGILIAGGGGSVTNSTVSGNGRMGIIGGATITVIDSTASGNGGDGISILGGGNSVVNSVANNNGGAGISLGCPSEAFGNTVMKNAGGNLVPSDNTCVLLDNKVQ